MTGWLVALVLYVLGLVMMKYFLEISGECPTKGKGSAGERWTMLLIWPLVAMTFALPDRFHVWLREKLQRIEDRLE